VKIDGTAILGQIMGQAAQPETKPIAGHKHLSMPASPDSPLEVTKNARL